MFDFACQCDAFEFSEMNFSVEILFNFNGTRPTDW